MGEVYRARDARLGRDVALKILPESFVRDEERLRRFEQEARAVAALNHPNILAVFDTGQNNEIAMHDTFVVRCRQPLRDLHCEFDYLALGERGAVQNLAQGLEGYSPRIEERKNKVAVMLTSQDQNLQDDGLTVACRCSNFCLYRNNRTK